MNKSYGYFFNAKGFNGRVICEWLMDTMVRVNSSPEAFPGLLADSRTGLAEAMQNLGSPSHFCFGGGWWQYHK